MHHNSRDVTALLPRKTIWWYTTVQILQKILKIPWDGDCDDDEKDDIKPDDDGILEVRTQRRVGRVGLSNKKLVCIWRRELRSDNEIFMIQIKYIAQ